MTITTLSGGITCNREETATPSNYMAAYVDSITPYEWAILRQFPAVNRVEQLVTTVAELRRYPLHPLHPLNPAARYQEARP